MEVVELATSLLSAKGSSDGDRLGGHLDVLNGLNDNNLADNVAVGDVVGADGRVTFGDGRVRGGRSRGRSGLGRRRLLLGEGINLGSLGGLLLEHAPGKIFARRRSDAGRVADARHWHLGGLGSRLVASGGTRAVLNNDISREGVANDARELLAGDHGRLVNLALALLVLALKGEDGAVRELAAAVGALIDSRLQEVGLPAADKVGMITKAYA